MGASLPCCKEQSNNKPDLSTPVPISNSEQLKTPSISIPSGGTVQFNKPIIRSQVEISPKREKQGRGPANYQSVKVLGKGSFGCVVLVEDKLTTRRYAMKMIPKSKIHESNLLQTSLIPSIRKHPFLTNIYETFQNNQNIYVVMEYLPKGDLYFYTHKQGVVLSETVIRDILAEVIVGIQYLHRQGIVYRQLKPENILVTEQGHIKLTDYGLSKLLQEDKRSKGVSTFIGAIQYMAPEAINGSFDQKADIWALGIVTFQLKFKQNPMEWDGHKNTTLSEYEAMLKNNYLQEKINSKIGYMSHQFRELLLRLLDQNPMNRVSLEELKGHSFFQGVNWAEVEQRHNPAPLSEIIKKNDLIKFRDPTMEQSKRREVFKRHPGGSKQNFSLNLFQVRISQ